MNISRPQSSQLMPEHAECVFSGKIFDTYQRNQTMYDGSIATFEKVKRTDTVVVFAILDNGNILLTRQEQPNKDPFIGACGGRIENNEDVLIAAKRELFEESGYEANEYILWKSLQPISKIDWAIYFFIAKDCKKISDQQLDNGEKVNLFEITFDEFLQIARDPTFIEKEILPDIYEALLDTDKYNELKKLFSPK